MVLSEHSTVILVVSRVNESCIASKKAKFHAATTLQNTLVEQRTREFLSSFEVIQAKLKKTYHLLTHGGDTELVPVNNLNIFGDGIEFSVRPPNKSWKSISNLSGGEKTLSSLSLIFALHHYKPTPFYIMDEIDAALDYRNVTIVGKYVKVGDGGGGGCAFFVRFFVCWFKGRATGTCLFWLF